MMRPTVPAALALAALTSACALPPRMSGPPPGEVRNLRVLVGHRTVSDDGWAPVADQTNVGVEFDTYQDDWYLGYEVGLAASSASESGQEADFYEGYVGLRKTWTEGRLHPYMAVGASMTTAELTQGTVERNDTGVGGYARIGATWNVTRAAHVGLDFRSLFLTDGDLQGEDLDHDYYLYSLSVGFSF